MDSDSVRAKKDELTRRDWLVRIGKTAAAGGLSGEVADAISSLAQSAPMPDELPPGLYQPSNDHLTHALGADGLFHPVPLGSETDFRVPRSGPYAPKFFSAEEFKVVGRIVELILGEPAGSSHETPSEGRAPGTTSADLAEWVDFVAANSVGVREAALKLAPDHRTLAIAYYGRERVEGLEKTDVPALCGEGLAWLAKRAQEKYGREFLALQESMQAELLREISDEPAAPAAPEAGRRFFRWLKSQVINGFYRSPEGLKELDQKGNSFYAESPGCSGHDHSGE
jgi:gluconate 2-dehydrogenase subunit 3-like protein